jgi:hypothetical protein
LGDGTRLKDIGTALRMTRRAVLLSAAAFPLAGCWRNRYEFNQKLTVTVSTPAGEKTASAVTQVVVLLGTILLSGSKAESRMEGEATVLEVLPGKYLFVLLGEDTQSLARRAWFGYNSALSPDEKYSALVKLRESKVLPPKLYPMMVTFGDINDPKSVIEVKPNALDKHFGAGIALKSICLEITDEPITEGKVEGPIPWLFDPDVMENPNWKTIPIAARRLLGDFLAPETAIEARKKYLKGKDP